MYFDLNVPISLPSSAGAHGKAKQAHSTLFSPAQLAAIEARIDLLVHCSSFLVTVSNKMLISRPVGYTVLAFNQCIKTKVEPKTFINTLDPLLRQVKKRQGVVYLKRLTIFLDEDSEKGFGLVRSYFPSHHVASLTQDCRQTHSPIYLVPTTSSHLHQRLKVASHSHALHIHCLPRSLRM
jgi:ribonuclease P/MRP protein subunit RPP1